MCVCGFLDPCSPSDVASNDLASPFGDSSHVLPFKMLTSVLVEITDHYNTQLIPVLSVAALARGHAAVTTWQEMIKVGKVLLILGTKDIFE